MTGKVRVIKRTDRDSLNSLKKEETPKASSKDNFRGWVAEWQSGTKVKKLPSLKDLFPQNPTLEN
jgi:hypothetical protein